MGRWIIRIHGGAKGGAVLISCLWDAQLAGVSMVDGSTSTVSATGLTTEQMQDQNILRDAGWDFSHVWTICEGDYPRLQWQAEDCEDSQ